MRTVTFNIMSNQASSTFFPTIRRGLQIILCNIFFCNRWNRKFSIWRVAISGKKQSGVDINDAWMVFCAASTPPSEGKCPCFSCPYSRLPFKLWDRCSYIEKYAPMYPALNHSYSWVDFLLLVTQERTDYQRNLVQYNEFISLKALPFEKTWMK